MIGIIRLIFGDFNFSKIDWINKTCDSKSRGFLSAVEDNFLSQIIDFPTHKAGTRPDLILTDCPGLVNEVCSLGNIGSSDHCAVLVNINVNFELSKTFSQTRNWFKGDYNAINCDITNLNWNNMFRDKHPEQCWDLFMNHINKLIDKYVPWKKPRPPGRPAWMNQKLIRLIRQKRKAWKSFSRSRDNDLYAKYKLLETQVKKAVRNAKKCFERKLACKDSKNSRAFYKYVGAKKTNRERIGPLRVGDIVVYDNKQMATTLNDFFASVFTHENVDFEIKK